MLNEHDLVKMALEINNQEEEHTPIRKAYDAATTGVMAGAGAVAGAVQGVKSLENRGPIKTIA